MPNSLTSIFYWLVGRGGGEAVGERGRREAIRVPALFQKTRKRVKRNEK